MISIQNDKRVMTGEKEKNNGDKDSQSEKKIMKERDDFSNF